MENFGFGKRMVLVRQNEIILQLLVLKDNT